MNAFHVCGGLFALWAFILFAAAMTRENFPSSAQAMRAICAISVVLALAAIGTAVYTGAHEEKEKGESSALQFL